MHAHTAFTKLSAILGIFYSQHSGCCQSVSPTLQCQSPPPNSSLMALFCSHWRSSHCSW